MILSDVVGKKKSWEKELKTAVVALFEVLHHCLPGRIYES